MPAWCLFFFLPPLVVFDPGLKAIDARPDAKAIVERSRSVLRSDWAASTHYDHWETDQDEHGMKTYREVMILGSPFKVEISTKQREQEEIQQETARRKTESAAQTRERIEKYQHERDREHMLMEQMIVAFDFSLAGEATIDGHRTYIVKATPNPGYKPVNTICEVLTGMKGTLWIDKASYQWVKAAAEVIHPVAIGGFLARVEPNTRFELERMPVADGIWLPKSVSIRAKAEILSFIGHRTKSDKTFFNYTKSQTDGQ